MRTKAENLHYFLKKSIEKMSKNVFILLTTTLLVFNECSNSQINTDSIPVINIESNMNNMQEVKLSRFTDNIQYVPLETLNDFVITGNFDCSFSDSYLIAKDMDKCLLYNYKGDFLYKIGNRGRGPGEYQYSMNTVIGLDEKIYIQSLYDLFEYNIDGSFFEKHKNTFRFNNEYSASWIIFQDSLIFAKIASSTGKEKYKALIINKESSPKYYFANYIHFDRKKQLAGDDEQYANIFRYQGKVYFKEVYNDTLFSLTEKYQLQPEIVITLGHFTKSLADRADISMEAMKKLNDYMSVDNVYLTNRYLFIDCFFSNQFSAKRLTPRVVFGNITTMYNTKRVLGIYDLNSRKLEFCKPTSTDNPLFTSGLYNDIDAGPRFFPKKQLNDSTFVMWVSVKELKDHIASDDFKNCIPKYPDKKKKLEELANQLSEFDNPVLMFVTFKK